MMFQSADATKLLTGVSTAEGDETPPEESSEVQAFELEVDVAQYLPEDARPVWDFVSSYPLALALLMGVLGWGVGKFLQFVIQKVLVKAATQTKTDLDDRLVELLPSPVLRTTVIVFLIPAVTAFKGETSIEQVVIRLLISLLLIIWARTLLKAVRLALKALSSNTHRFEMIQPRTVPLFEMTIKIVLVIVFAYLLMNVWGIDGTAWLASAGIVGIAVGFAAKDTLANLISGVSIVADAPYKIGDYIVLDTGERGIVTSLGIRSTRLLTRDDVEVSIPNAVIGNAKITNESGGPWIKQRLRIPVGVAYGSNTEEVVEVLEGVARDNPDMINQPAPRVRMRAFGASSLDFELLGWINNPEDRGRVRHELFLEIDKRFREHEIVIPFPQTDVHLHELGEKTASEPNLADDDSSKE